MLSERAAIVQTNNLWLIALGAVAALLIVLLATGTVTISQR